MFLFFQRKKTISFKATFEISVQESNLLRSKRSHAKHPIAEFVFCSKDNCFSYQCLPCPARWGDPCIFVSVFVAVRPSAVCTAGWLPRLQQQVYRRLELQQLCRRALHWPRRDRLHADTTAEDGVKVTHCSFYHFSGWNFMAFLRLSECLNCSQLYGELARLGS